MEQKVAKLTASDLIKQNLKLMKAVENGEMGMSAGTFEILRNATKMMMRELADNIFELSEEL